MIELKQISKSFKTPDGGSIKVANQLELSIEKGETVGIAGASGSGKTTVINMIAGLLTPDKGSVYVGGKDLYSMSEATRDRFRAGNIGYIFQNYNLIASLSAYDNVMAALYFGRRVSKRERRERCEQLLSLVGLSERIKHLPRQLSGGEQQRVCIARAIANHPPVLLADEPTANLDSRNRESVALLLSEACSREGITLVAATHDEGLLKHMQRVINL